MLSHNVNLGTYHTFGINSVAASFVEVRSVEQLSQLIRQQLLQQPMVVLGGGSNMLFPDRYEGLVLRVALKGIRMLRNSGDEVLVEASAGEEWDPFVRYCAQQGWYGLENLSAIPGTVGASAVQNVGAYGVEAAQRIESVNAINVLTGQPLCLSAEECMFGYRDSIFKHQMAGQYVITSVVYRLQRDFNPCLSHTSLTQALRSQNLDHPSPQQFIEVLSALRWSKLPRPGEMGSVGSFFKNPIVTVEQYQRIKTDYPDVVAYPTQDGYKVAAGWLIERCGWKGKQMGRCGVYDKQALVLVNCGGCTFGEVQQLAQAITDDVQDHFGVTLEREAIFNIA